LGISAAHDFHATVDVGRALLESAARCQNAEGDQNSGEYGFEHDGPRKKRAHHTYGREGP
ncbi:hypothetical protein NLR20_25340, partial [Escherichia coli]|nr:hypothetical protein [Escherichia coli]